MKWDVQEVFQNTTNTTLWEEELARDTKGGIDSNQFLLDHNFFIKINLQ